MGSAAFAVPSIEALFASAHRVVEVVTQPDKPAGRGMKIRECPAAKVAKKLGLPLFQPGNVRGKDTIEHLRSLRPDLIVVVAYGKILPPEVISIPGYGAVNVHASLLPKYRGAAPINWAIVMGERETGVTTQLIGNKLDAGDILFSVRTPIDDSETAEELHERLAPIGARLLIETIGAIERGEAKPMPQDDAAATYAPVLKKEDGRIDWTKSAWDLFNMVRGLWPWPGTYTTVEGKILRVHKVALVETSTASMPGTIVEVSPHLEVACGDGSLRLLEVQLEGKRRMSVGDFLRGHKIEKGVLLK